MSNVKCEHFRCNLVRSVYGETLENCASHAAFEDSDGWDGRQAKNALRDIEAEHDVFNGCPYKELIEAKIRQL